MVFAWLRVNGYGSLSGEVWDLKFQISNLKWLPGEAFRPAAFFFSHWRRLPRLNSTGRRAAMRSDFKSAISDLELEAEVGIEGRPPSAVLLRAQFRPDNTGVTAIWQDRPSSRRPTHFQRSLTEEFTEGQAAVAAHASIVSATASCFSSCSYSKAGNEANARMRH